MPYYRHPTHKRDNMNEVQLGLKANWKQFSLLVLINGFVGGMVGLERTILPEMAEKIFGLSAKTEILFFIVVFGITKAITNYFTGTLADKYGRKKLLILGWFIGFPIPIILIFAPSWNWILLANILLGINQGLTWSSTVVMKIDLVGPKNRGLAMGINESVGYLAIAIIAFTTGYLANECGPRPYPFIPGIAIASAGLLASIFLVKDTRNHVGIETQGIQSTPILQHVFKDTSWRNPNLSSVTQAGFINNLNDGMIWGLLPVYLSSLHFNLLEIGRITSIYPFVWGLGQLITGKIADHISAKSLLFGGMLLQSLSILTMAAGQSYSLFFYTNIVLGIGTAIVYPTLLVAIANQTHPIQRAESIGVFRLWRDLGYAVGALLTGLLADIWDLKAAIITIGFLTLFSAVIIAVRMKPISA